MNGLLTGSQCIDKIHAHDENSRYGQKQVKISEMFCHATQYGYGQGDGNVSCGDQNA